MIFGLIEAIRWESSDILLRMPFILIWRILKSLLREVGGLGVVSESEEVEEFEGDGWEGDEGGEGKRRKFFAEFVIFWQPKKSKTRTKS